VEKWRSLEQEREFALRNLLRSLAHEIRLPGYCPRALLTEFINLRANSAI